MYDSGDEYSDAVFYTLTDLGNGKYTLVINADKEWINQENRQFPVTIDPAIYPADGTTVYDTYINSYSTSNAPSGLTYLYVGNTTQFYWRAATLPAIPDSAYITNATFSAYYVDSKTVTADYYFGAYQVTSNWDNTLTWSKYKTSSPEGAYVYADIVDYQVANFNAGTPTTYSYTWNVTEIVRNWTNGAPNYGICISDIPGYLTKNCKFGSSEMGNVNKRPSLLIEYRDMKGLEDYWSFTAQDIGNAGTGYVNNATGNLTVVLPTLSTTDALFGYTPSLVYNSALANKTFTSSYANTPYTSAHAGYGFKLSTQESIVQRSYVHLGSTITYYIWTDSDGTEHAFVQDSNGVYRDEDGLGLKLSIGTALTISDRSNNKKTFSTFSGGWIMTSITDNIGNKLNFNVDSLGRVTSITVTPQGSSEISFLNFNYNSSGYVSEIINTRANKKMEFDYSSNCLQHVWYYSGAEEHRIATYSYASDGTIQFIVDDLAGYFIDYAYTSGKVTRAIETAGSNDTTGQAIGFTYNGGFSVVRTSGKNDIYNDLDDILTNYVFDSYGRTISVYSTDLNKNTVYGANSGTYDNSDLSKNNVKTLASTAGASSNYIMNGGFEQYDESGSVAYWHMEGNVSIGSFPAGFGNYDMVFSLSDYEEAEIYQYVTLPKGKYTLSLDAFTAESGSGNFDFSVIVQSLHDSSRRFVEKISKNKFYASGTATTVVLDFEAATVYSTEDFKISIYVNGSDDGTDKQVSVDNIMLENNESKSEFSLIDGGSFESTYLEENGDMLYSPTDVWSISNGGLSVSEQPFNQTLKLNGNLSSQAYARQYVYSISQEKLEAFYQNGTVNQYDTVFKLSGFGKASTQMFNENSRFGIVVDVNYLTNEGEGTVSTYFEFDRSSTDWQYMVGVVPLDGNCTVRYIDITCVYDYNYGSAYFDELKFEIVADDTAQLFEYNNGKIVDYRTGIEKTHTTYTAEDQIEYVVSKTGNSVIKYEYLDDNYYVPEAVKTYKVKASAGGYNAVVAAVDSNDASLIESKIIETTSIKYIYNDYGLPTQTQTWNNTSSAYLAAYTTYNVEAGSAIFGTVSTQIDVNGDVARFFYNSNTGELVATIDGNNNGYTFAYDTMGRTTQILPAVYSNSTYNSVTGLSAANYTYNSAGKLSGITVGSGSKTESYTFNYDVFGNKTSIGVGSNTLMSYTYANYNGKLETETYSNGTGVKYVYDDIDRISEIWYNSGGSEYIKTYEYYYDANGNVTRIRDFINNKIRILRYDNNNRFIFSTEYNASAPLNEYGLYATYDTLSRLDDFYYSFDYNYLRSNTTSADLWYDYQYATDSGNNSSNTVESWDLNNVYGMIGGFNATNYYDEFNRKDGYSLCADNGSETVKYINSFSYSGSQISGQNNYINSVLQTVYNFTYDNNGNIISVLETLSNQIICTYEYDTLNRLVRENNAKLGKSYKYNYDVLGNITSKQEYSYTTGTLGSVISTKNYSYGNSSWKDQLTAFNGVSISYDASGNPLSYYNGSSYNFTWTQGRRLESATKGGEISTYTYNSDGIRTGKTVGGVKHTYVLNGNAVYSDSWSIGYTDYMVIYVYDETGAPVGMMYRTSLMNINEFEYYVFEKNIVGDVVAIYNTSGTKLVDYTYDAWGNVITTYYNGGASTAVQYNSIRYRGYFYDSEINLYYLNSRYYDPATGRFLNPDIYINANGDLTGFNMYAYCSNNPVMYVDAFGYSLMKALAQWDWESIFMPKHSSICMGGMSNKMYNDTHSTGINASFQTWSRMQHFSDPWGYSAYDVGYGTRFFYSGTSSNYSYLRDGTFVCFVAGTPVLAESGQKAIEDIAPGDYVWATNEKTGETSLKEVVRVFVNETNELIHVTINGETISCTKEHPFYSPVKGWISACNLKSGDILVTVNGEYVVIEKVQHELLEAAVKVYNFEVEEYHTYYVGTQCILVHNDCGAKYEIHHVVERCQQKKSGFGKDKIENPFNKVPIEYSIHRRISAYYSSKQFYTNGLRVRDWLAGQSFDEQTRFGWKIIRMYLEE